MSTKQPAEYRIEVSPAADRDLDKLKGKIRRQDFERFRSAISALANQPRPRSVRKIKGAETVYRIRIGAYRIVYDVFDDSKPVLILQVTRRTETTYHQ